MSLYNDYKVRSILATIALEFPEEYRTIVASFNIQTEQICDNLEKTLKALRDGTLHN